jgi:hypothetical protein
VADRRLQIKLPEEPVRAAEDRAKAQGRTLASVMKDAITLFTHGKLAPRQIPRSPYGSNQNKQVPAGIQMSEIQEGFLNEAREAFAARYQRKHGVEWNPPLAAIVLTHLENFAYEKPRDRKWTVPAPTKAKAGQEQAEQE